MKAFSAAAIAIALFAGVATASAQNATPTTKVSSSPSNINKSNRATVPSGAEAPAAVAGQHARITGHGKFCKPIGANGGLTCLYASMDACKKHNKASSLHCVANPKFGT
jgi:hypothetical protein